MAKKEKDQQANNNYTHNTTQKTSKNTRQSDDLSEL